MMRIADREILRVIDANLNRSREGLRVCEDIARFILNSASLTREIKSVRHRISDIVKNFNGGLAGITEFRNSDEDVGRRLNSPSEMRRLDLQDVFYANIERAKESLRVLEEFFKLADRKNSGKFSVLRFRVYEIEKRAAKRIGEIR